ncbi:MAG: AAA family ATPase [Pirellulaceae bacterium]
MTRTKSSRTDPPLEKTDRVNSSTENYGLRDSFSFRLNIDLPVSKEEFAKFSSVLGKLVAKNPAEAREEARRQLAKLTIDSNAPYTEIDTFRFALSCVLSDRVLEGYSTLDEQHLADIGRLISSIESYIERKTQKRPLNFLMLASPGAGKSHFIECIAKRLGSKRIAAITFNMASMTNNDELVRPLDQARNAKVEDKIPLLFLDEFDSSTNNYGLLLPLLWDGAISLGQRDLKLGKVIIILAGSSPTLPEALDHAKSLRSEIPLPSGTNSKVVDLFSRINGSVLRIPEYHNASRGIDRRIDKVAIAANLLMRRFSETREMSHMVPLAFFGFIATIKFRYDVRSIAHLIDLVNFKQVSDRSGRMLWVFEPSSIPLDSVHSLRNSSLVYHLIDDENHAHGVVDKWKTIYECRTMIPLRTIGALRQAVDNEFFHRMYEIAIWNTYNEHLMMYQGEIGEPEIEVKDAKPR